MELEKWEQTLHGYPWRTTKGAAPCAVKVACTVLNGEDEETGLKVLRLVLTQRNVDPDLPCLRGQPTEPETTAPLWKYGPMQYGALVLHPATWINLSYSMSTLGSRKERMGQVENTPPTALRSSPTC